MADRSGGVSGSHDYDWTGGPAGGESLVESIRGGLGRRAAVASGRRMSEPGGRRGGGGLAVGVTAGMSGNVGIRPRGEGPGLSGGAQVNLGVSVGRRRDSDG